MKIHFILYVEDQESSTEFYTKVLNSEPALNVPGMTEFALSNDTILGLMPVTGIKKLIGNSLPDPDKASGIPRSEVYLLTDTPEVYCQRAQNAGAIILSPLEKRDWGHAVAYFLDPDGHVLAFAKQL